MKRFYAVGSACFLVLGVLEGCGSDDKAPASGPSPTSDAGPDGMSGNGGANGAAGGGGGGATSAGGSSGAGGSTASRDAGLDGRGPEQTGQTCQTPADCYPNVADAGALSGAVECLDKVQDGYCTHQCNTDADCCAVPGECRTDLKQVCSPFENTGYKVCFLSCENVDIHLPDGGTTLADGGPVYTSANDFCHKEAGIGLDCRSTGGGSQNRKVCLPVPPPGDGGPPRPDAGGSSTDAATDAAPVTDAAAATDAAAVTDGAATD